MRLQIHSTGIGATTFSKRLSVYLRNYFNIEIVEDKPDIYLSCIWAGKPPKNAIHIHRVDGAYFDITKKSNTNLNSKLQQSINRANAIVYQSIYSRNICHGILKVKNLKDTIIYNGIDESVFNNIQVNKFGYDKMFVACAKWRALKRPKSIAKGFVAANIKNAVLVMIGEIDKSSKVNHPNIKYLGKMKSSHTYGLYASCNGVIHISRLDACPNVVVEGLVALKPILCNNVGGTPEIVKNDGVILNIDPPFQYKCFKMGDPDNVRSEIIADGIHQLLSTSWSINRQDLTMKTCATNYYNYFMELLHRV